MGKQEAIRVLMQLLAGYDGGPEYEALCIGIDAIQEARKATRRKNLEGGKDETD